MEYEEGGHMLEHCRHSNVTNKNIINSACLNGLFIHKKHRTLHIRRRAQNKFKLTVIVCEFWLALLKTPARQFLVSRIETRRENLKVFLAKTFIEGKF